MSDSSSSRLTFDFSYRPAGQPSPVRAETPIHLLLVADFSGRTNRGVHEPLAARKLLAVDADNFASAPARCGTALNLPLESTSAAGGTSSTSPPRGGPLTLRLESLDDFHPDAVLKHLPSLASLLAARRALDSPATAASAAETLQNLLAAAPPPSPAEPAAPSGPASAATESTDTTLARLLGQAPGGRPTKPSPKGFDAQALIKQVLASSSSAVPAPSAGMAGLIAAAELELATRLRALLHDRQFRSVEAAWRSADFLVRRCPDEERVKLFLLDATLAELSADPPGLPRLLRDRRWAVIVADFTFGVTSADLTALRGLAATCAALGCGLLAGAHPQLVNCDSLAAHPDPDDWGCAAPAEVHAAWQSLRRAPEAGHVGLALPRFMLRQPYGAGSDPIESFAFTEILDPASPEAYLWGNSAVLCAQLLAEALAATEGESEFAGAGDIGELPVFKFTKDGERVTQPCAEAWLSDRAAEVILAHGLIPVLSIKGRDGVRVVNVRSIADPARPLAVGR